MSAMNRLRMRAFYGVLGPVQEHFRARRMRLFSRFIDDLPAGARVLDLGGQPRIWRHVPRPLSITILNLPGIVERLEGLHHEITYVEGDACDLPYPDASFDLVFSNSVIEHVGDHAKRAAFAREARRVGGRLWIQTPSVHFPVDPHTGMPFWWRYPEALRQRFIARWRKTYPAWTEMVAGTTVVARREMTELFPDCRVMTERAALIPKSYVALRS